MRSADIGQIVPLKLATRLRNPWSGIRLRWRRGFRSAGALYSAAGPSITSVVSWLALAMPCMPRLILPARSTASSAAARRRRPASTLWAMPLVSRVLDADPVASLDDYVVAHGGGRGLTAD